MSTKLAGSTPKRQPSVNVSMSAKPSLPRAPCCSQQNNTVTMNECDLSTQKRISKAKIHNVHKSKLEILTLDSTPGAKRNRVCHLESLDDHRLSREKTRQIISFFQQTNVTPNVGRHQGDSGDIGESSSLNLQQLRNSAKQVRANRSSLRQRRVTIGQASTMEISPQVWLNDSFGCRNDDTLGADVVMRTNAGHTPKRGRKRKNERLI